ncbi:hypothetical protein [Chryseobacterium sp. R2A-55]|uniref:hypothetical protein n=1 Tax=Chryseobacterium sp. R2A-55 TaxID=2744445 RepID=UPI001F409E88|nr:hypothetical protein [Chryseobacterium sp. R2A-55]
MTNPLQPEIMKKPNGNPLKTLHSGAFPSPFAGRRKTTSTSGGRRESQHEDDC